jgi:hypothetical protein
MATNKLGIAAFALAATLSLSAMAQTGPDRSSIEWLASHPNPFIPAESVGEPLETRRWADCAGMWAWAARQCEGLKAAWFQGRATWYLSGYAWHIPGTWSDEKLNELNQHAWGGGYGFARNDERGDNYSW